MENPVKQVTQKQFFGNVTLLDGALIGASKITTEALLSKIKYIGNGTLKSGLIKSGVALASSLVAGKFKVVKIVSTGILIDGMEDVALGLYNFIKGKYSTKSENGQKVETFAGNYTN